MADFRPKPFVFVLMPFDHAFDDVYQLGIKVACERAGAYAERVDEQIFEGSILQRIYNQISKADVVVADMSGRNPNVFYESGYAHALGKPVILLTQNTDDIPFDLKHYPHIVYHRRIVDLLPELEKRLRFFIESPMGPASARYQALRLYVNDTLVSGTTRVAIGIKPARIGFWLQIDVHNPVEREIRTAECQIGLITPSVLVGAELRDSPQLLSSFKLEGDKHLHLIHDMLTILPGAWKRVTIIPTTEMDPVFWTAG